MANYYLGVMLIPSLLLAFVLWFWGLDNNKDHESGKALLSRIVFYIQFLGSLGALYFVERTNHISFTYMELSYYHYELTFSVETFQIVLAAIFSLLFILVEKLSYNYLHAEEEHAKFYGLKMFLNISTMMFIFSSNIDFLFFAWEIVGLSSALLISYFYRRNQAVEHSLFAFSVYRFCDAAFLFSGLLLYYFYKTESIQIVATGSSATILGILFFVAVMGKSGIYPFSSWLPLALEGPTPSSNLYYTTLSTHLGVIFLLKTYSLWGGSDVAKIVIILWSLVSLCLTALSARVQTNIKGALAYSTLAQVALIIIEVAIGWHTLALVHLGIHIFYRFSQMSNAPSIIDHHNLIERISKQDVSPKYAGKLYFLALHGFKSEVIILKIFKFILIPFFLLDHFENKILFYRNNDNGQQVAKS